jgi:YHS domain-containing protein
VVVYSAKRLYLQSPVVETKLDPTDAAYKFAYSGLKLLFRSDHKYFLRPNNPGAVANIVLPDTLDIRIEFFPGQ